MQKTGKIALIAGIGLAAVVAVSTAAGAIISASALRGQEELKKAVGELAEGQKNSSAELSEALEQLRLAQEEANAEYEFHEDGVMIAGRYEIISTLPISDAYKSGDTSALSDNDKETLDMAKAVIDEYITDGMTDFEKEKAIYEFITGGMGRNAGALSLLSDGSGEYYTPHDVLKNGSAVCVGFATTFRLFMQMLDIECKVVHDTYEGHSWDLIKLDDGWYHTDCYMDSGSTNYRSFNMDDGRCSLSHDWEREYYPSADGIKYDVAMMNCDTLPDIYSIPEWFMKAADERKDYIGCVFEGGIPEGSYAEAAYMVNSLESQTYNPTFCPNFIWRDAGERGMALCVYMGFNDLEPQDTGLDYETTNKIDSAIFDAMEAHNFHETFGESEWYCEDPVG